MLSAILVDVLLFSFQGSLCQTLSRQLLYHNKFSLSCQQNVLLILFHCRVQLSDLYYITLHISQSQRSNSKTHKNIEMVITLAIPGRPRKAISNPETILIGILTPN